MTSNWVSPPDASEGQIYWGNSQIAYRAANGLTYFEHRNWVNSDRVHTNPSGASAATYTSFAFGDGGSVTNTDAYATWDFDHFGDMDYNLESNTHHAQFRQYSPAQGRWMSPDPYAGSYDLTNPQSLNRYTYALNNPLSSVDPSGYDCVYLNNSGTGIDPNGIDTNSNSDECGDHGGFWVDGTFTSGTVYSNSNDVYLRGFDSSTGQLTDSYSNVVTANGSSPINTDVFSLPNLFAYSPTKPLPPSVLKEMIHSLNRSGRSDALVGCIVAGESSGRPGAHASPPSTAKGLMQVNNTSAGDIARRNRSAFGGMSGFQLSSQMFDPAVAITAGTSLLSDKISAAGGDWVSGLENYYGSNDPVANAEYAAGKINCAQNP